MKKNTVHLVANSHIDPVWLWQWEEGAGEALSTFRTAAALCEAHEDFVFNHNEAILYQWIEEYEPQLFQRIRRLVRAGRWHIMGGWYLQPDCNMPSGESFVRQILLGKRYFREKFGVDVTTAANLDPFGHTRGLVQILARSGYDAYYFCRPAQEDFPLPDDAFTWVGFDGSTVTATRASAHYNSPPGGTRAKVEQWLETFRDRPCSTIPWGVGNHGGGPSRQDLRELADLIRDRPDLTIAHSTPEHYFDDLRASGMPLPRVERDLTPWAVGCYTSMHRVKHLHRRLENAMFMTEKMATTAAMQGLIDYPRAELRHAARDLASAQFHDALPGSSIEPVEHATLHLIGHGIETLSRLRARAFFALCSGQPEPADGGFPVLVYNPHPFPVTAIVECELQPHWPHLTGKFMQPTVYGGRTQLPTQAERPFCNINEDHRKRVVFRGILKPAQMNRFDCRLDLIPHAPRPRLKSRNGRIRFTTRDLDIVINTRTGLLDRYRVAGTDCLTPGAGRLIVMHDNADAWGMTVTRFRKQLGRFTLLSRRDNALLSGLDTDDLPSVRVIEDGPVRAIVEVMLGYHRSHVCQRYKLPKHGTEIELELRVHWNENDRMLKLALPTTMSDGTCLRQVAYGTADMPMNGDEVVVHKWAAMVSRKANLALTCINNAVYGLDAEPGELRLSLLRSPAHAGHRVGDLPITDQDRYTPRLDQGEHVFRFWLNAGPAAARMAAIDREALAHAERPFALCFFPSGVGTPPLPGPLLTDRSVQLIACKYAEDNNDLVLRLYEPTGRTRSTVVILPFYDARCDLRLRPFEVKTLRFVVGKRCFVETNLLEQPLK